MPFDPDAYLSGSGTATFNPDEYLGSPKGFDPNAYLGIKPPPSTTPASDQAAQGQIVGGPQVFTGAEEIAAGRQLAQQHPGLDVAAQRLMAFKQGLGIPSSLQEAKDFLLRSPVQDVKDIAAGVVEIPGKVANMRETLAASPGAAIIQDPLSQEAFEAYGTATGLLLPGIHAKLKGLRGKRVIAEPTAPEAVAAPPEAAAPVAEPATQPQTPPTEEVQPEAAPPAEAPPVEAVRPAVTLTERTLPEGDIGGTVGLEIKTPEGVPIGDIGGKLTPEGFTVNVATIDKPFRGKGNYQAAIQQMADKYGTVRSSVDMTPAAEAAWKKVGAEPQPDGSYVLRKAGEEYAPKERVEPKGGVAEYQGNGPPRAPAEAGGGGGVEPSAPGQETQAVTYTPETWAAESEYNKAQAVKLDERLVKHPKFAQLKAEVDKKWARSQGKGKVLNDDPNLQSLYLTTDMGSEALQNAIAKDLGIKIVKSPKSLFGSRYLDIPLSKGLKGGVEPNAPVQAQEAVGLPPGKTTPIAGGYGIRPRRAALGRTEYVVTVPEDEIGARSVRGIYNETEARAYIQQRTGQPAAPPAQQAVEAPVTQGISQARTEAELGAGSVEPGVGAEMGSGLAYGRNFINKGGDPRLPIRRAETSGLVGKNEVGIVHAELERLRGVRDQAARVTEANPNDLLAQKALDAADNAQRAWRKELQPVLTKASDALREAYAESTVPDVGTYGGLANLVDEHFKGKHELTPADRTVLQKVSKTVSDARAETVRSVNGAVEATSRVSKRVMTPEQLKADLASVLTNAFKDCIL